MWPVRLCSATTCHLPPDPQLVENICMYIRIYTYIAHTHTHTLAKSFGQPGDWRAGRHCLAMLLQQLHGASGAQLVRGKDEKGLWLKFVGCSLPSSAQLKTSIWVCHKLHRAQSAQRALEGSARHAACGMWQVAGKTVKEIKYLAQPWLFNELNCSTNNIYLRPAYFAYDIRYSNTITCAVNLQLKWNSQDIRQIPIAISCHLTSPLSVHVSLSLSWSSNNIANIKNSFNNFCVIFT